MKRSLIKGGLAVLLGLTLVAAACSNGKTENVSNNGGNDGGKVKIEYFQMKSEVVEIVNDLIAKFETENPGIIVEQNNVPNPENVWSMRVSTNDAPAAFTHYPHNPVFQKMAIEGRVVDLTNDPLLDNVLPAIAEISKIEGKNYMVPIGLATLGVYYNKAIFAEHGLQVPTTYAEFIDVSEKLKAAGVTPMLFHDKDFNGIRQEVVYKMGQTMPNVEQFLDDVMNGKAHITDNPEFKPFAEKLLALREFGQKDIMGTGYDDALREFSNGKAAMWFTGIWAQKEIKLNNPELDFAMFPLPTEKAEDLKTQVSVDTAIGLPTGGKNEAEARKFVEFMSSKEAVEAYLEKGGYPSGINGVDTGSAEMASLSQLIKDGKVYPTIERVWPPGLNAEVGKATQEMFVTKDIEQYLKALDSIFYNVLNQ
ncbi:MULTISPECIES: ABC transporter substrate-binding protein [unclassified Paenibacillus]|uniref:ABC transporter substrate-binding protein n=1 Tax=unclassified Paenibacillus TaxID=185978 RepID=UPI002F3F5E5F